jgi:hypothetical protein
MLKIKIVLILLLFTTNTFAECNLELAKASGTYLSELEKLKLYRYQNNSVCEVLSNEFWNCTEAQKAKLNQAFEVKEVLGNYCGPHLPPPKYPISKNDYMKGISLFSWKDADGYFWYALLPGTNRLKTSKELLDYKVSEGYLKEKLKNLPENVDISWNNLIEVSDKEKLEFSLPEKKKLEEIKKSAQKSKLKIEL